MLTKSEVANTDFFFFLIYKNFSLSSVDWLKTLSKGQLEGIWVICIYSAPLLSLAFTPMWMSSLIQIYKKMPKPISKMCILSIIFTR